MDSHIHDSEGVRCNLSTPLFGGESGEVIITHRGPWSTDPRGERSGGYSG